MNNVTMGFSPISVSPLSLRPRGTRGAPSMPAEPEPDPSFPIRPHERSGRRAMTAETPEPRFERFCLAYPSGTAVMAYYGDGAAVGEEQASPLLAVVEAVEDSRVSLA
jgi:hypothetical protein